MTLAEWDKRFISVANLVSEWSKDPNAKVGAVIVDAQGQIAAAGYNGFPKMVEDRADRLSDKDVKLEMIVHAEENAILGAGTRARGGSIYVVGKPVCARCAGSLIQAGIRRIIAQKPEENSDSRWAKSGKIALEMLEEAQVEFIPSSESK